MNGKNKREIKEQIKTDIERIKMAVCLMTGKR